MKSLLYRCFFILLSVLLLSPWQGRAFASDGNAWGTVDVFTQVSAGSFCLMDADTGHVILSQGENLSFPMASTTKIMTCLVALENAHPASIVSIPKEAVGIEGSSVYLVAGEELSLMDLLYALMLESANDAAVAIALFVSGSVENFSEKMNEKARELELSQTFYQNPHGLSAENHRSSAEDLAKLMAYAMKNETFAEIVATKTKTISAPGDGTRYLSNHNRLLRTFPLCIGGKTGYTKEAGRCLVTAAKKDGKTLVCATLNAPDDWNDHVALLNHGFSLYSVKTVLAEEEIQVEIPVVGGVSSSVCLFNASSLQLSLRAEDRFTYVLEAPMFFYAPLTAEDRVLGEAVCFVNGEEVARISLYGKEGVPVREETPGFWKSLWIMIKNIFR